MRHKNNQSSFVVHHLIILKQYCTAVPVLSQKTAKPGVRIRQNNCINVQHFYIIPIDLMSAMCAVMPCFLNLWY